MVLSNAAGLFPCDLRKSQLMLGTVCCSGYLEWPLGNHWLMWAEKEIMCMEVGR